jgi:Family of unknown function (DUF5723)
MKTRFLVAVLLAVIINSASAQNSQILYFMNLPQNHLLNPALRSSNRIYIGFPGLTGINFNISNNFISFSDLFPEGLEISESTIPFLNSDFDTDEFLGGLKDLNYLEPRASVQLIGIGLTTKNDFYFFLDISERAEVNVVFPRDLLTLAFLGPEELAGRTFDMSALKADVMYFRETGFGFSKKVTSRLRIGAKGKLLFGMAAGSFRNESLTFTVDDDFSNRLVADMGLRMSGPVKFFLDPEHKIDDVRFNEDVFETSRSWKNFFTNTRNAGLGLDLGAEFEITPKIVVSAAVTDLGFIRWKTDISNLKATGEASMEGISITDIQNGSATFDQMIETMADTLINALTVTDSEEPFTTFLPFGVTLGGKFNVTDKFSVGLLSHSRKTDQQLKEALSLSANFNLGNTFSASLAYTASNHSYNNFGAGFGVRAGFAQLYFLVDRIPLNWKSAGSGKDRIVLPENWNTLHARFGLNLVFGNRGGKIQENSSATLE